MSFKLGRKWWARIAVAVAAPALALSSTSLAHAEEGGHGGHGGHGGGGDACTFFLDHMWANEDGIPLLGSPSHLNEYHTDPTYDNLILSLASGAIGNSEMPVIDIYGGPLGWIPVFNPAHVKGHGTDYVTLLTSCGGVGIPMDTNDLTALNVDSVEQLADMSDLIMPGLPTPEMLTDPTYVWKTTDASDILARVTPETLTNMEEYAGFAGDHFDTWRLLWETALNDVSNGNPTGILDVLEITDNINTLESLSGPLGGDIGSDLLGDNGVSDLLGEDPTSGLLGQDPVSGLLGGGGGLGGLLGGGDTSSPDLSKYSALLTGATDASSGAGQCQASLNGNVLTITCVYAGMASEVTEVYVNAGDDQLQLETTGGTSGGAVGSFELTEDQVAALNNGEFALEVSTAGSGAGELSGVIEPCGCA